METVNDTSSVPEGHPASSTSIEAYANTAFLQALRANTAKAVKSPLSPMERGNGVESIALQQEKFVPITQFNSTGALSGLNAFQVFGDKLVLEFKVTFLTKANAVGLLTSSIGPHLTQFKLKAMYFAKGEKRSNQPKPEDRCPGLQEELPGLC